MKLEQEGRMGMELDAGKGLAGRDLSWVNWLARLVDRLPLPGPVWYLAAGAAAIGLFVLNDWLAFGQPKLALGLFHLTLALEPVYSLALIHFLDRRAARALQRMRVVLIEPEALEELQAQVTRLPAGATLLASLVGMLLGILAVAIERTALPAVFRQYVPATGGRWLVEVWLVITWFVFGALFFHTWHQLHAINRIYVKHTIIDLDYYQPLFHFSKVSAMTAVGLAAIPYTWYLAVPNLILEPMGLAFGALFPALAVTSFVWPLIGIHNLMVEAKGHAVVENGRVLKDVRERLFEHAKAGTLGGAADLHEALQAIRAERVALLKVPTWPWQPDTPRSVAAALALPLAVWFLQWVLQRVLGS